MKEGFLFMKVLITGGAGFIGSHVCEAVLKKGHDVICVDNFNNYYDPKIKEENIAACLKNSSFTLRKTDITCFEELDHIFKEEAEIEVVIHLAARAGVRPSIENPLLYEQVNVRGTLNLLELCKKYQVRKFVFGSSSSVYGENKKVPFSESDPLPNMVSPYAVTKRAAEMLCQLYHDLHGIDMVCLRLFTVYGPRGRPEMAAYLFSQGIDQGKEIQVFGDGTTERDYTYVADIVEGIIACLGKDFGFEIINLGNSSPISLKKFVSVAEKVVGKKAIIKRLPMQNGDVTRTYADISKAKKLIGYSPQTNIEKGMKKVFEWYQKERK